MGLKCKLHSLLTSALGSGQWSGSHLGHSVYMARVRRTICVGDWNSPQSYGHFEEEKIASCVGQRNRIPRSSSS